MKRRKGAQSEVSERVFDKGCPVRASPSPCGDDDPLGFRPHRATEMQKRRACVFAPATDSPKCEAWIGRATATRSGPNRFPTESRGRAAFRAIGPAWRWHG